MNPTVADIQPKTLEGAKRQFVELYGSALVMNTYLKIAVVLLALVALSLVALNFRTVAAYSNVKPLVVRIDDVSRTEIRNPPYKAAVTFQKLLYTSGTRSERGH